MLGNDSAYNLGRSLFARSNNQNQNSTFRPNFEKNLLQKSFESNSPTIQTVNAICENSLECRFDFAMTLNEKIAESTLKFSEKLKYIRDIFSK